uniref:Uncharacterized protein n=1 Tax=Brassica oleracea var. oleracea TaxID=109376 RepID=A0A0D3AY67_BRAOL
MISKQWIEKKILLSICFSTTTAFFRSEQGRIIQKRTQQQLGETTPNVYGQHFGDFGGVRSNLPEY